MMSRHGAAAALLASVIVWAVPKYALNVGTVTPAAVSSGQNITIPIVLDLSAATGADVGSLSFDLKWDAAKLSFVSGAPDAKSGFTLVDNRNNAAAGGVIRASGFTVSGATTTRTLYTLVLAAKKTAVKATTVVAATVSVGGDGHGKNITIVPRNLTVNIAP